MQILKEVLLDTAMLNIGIISGGGKLPLSVGKNLLKKNYKVCFFLIDGFANSSDYKKYLNVKIKLNSFTDILKSLSANNIDQIVMLGKITRPSIKDIKFDLNTINLIKNYLLEAKGDDQLLKSISSFFSNKGFPLFNWQNVCDDLFSSENCLTKKMPSKNAIKNLNKGLEIFKIIGNADLGQSIVIQNQLVLGIECLEGTDELIKRCNDYKNVGDKNILLKLSKYNQHHSIDLPTIGIETIKNMNLYNYEGLFIEKNKCIILEKDNLINYCNNNNIFLSTINKID